MLTLVTLVLLSLTVGSFLNVLIWRLNEEGVPKWWEGRSLCPRCRKEISWKDNIPLVSFVWLKGKCRWCHKRISWQYPIVELVTAVTFLIIGWQPSMLLIASCFIVIFFSDWVYGLIPDEMVAAAIFLSLLGYLSHLGDLGMAAATGLVSALFFFLIVLVTRFRGMGLGDVKLAFLMGIFLGYPRALVAFWAAFILGGLAAVMLLVLRRKKFSETIAFGPYLVLGTVLSALWTNSILQVLR